MLTDDESNCETELTSVYHQIQVLYYSVLHCISLQYVQEDLRLSSKFCIALYFTVFPRTTRIRHQIQVPAAGLMMAGGLTKAKADAKAQELRQI